ncbi:MAG: glycosyltransferase family 2 protein [bacterium]
MPRVGILLPVYRVERELAEALESLLAQTFTDWETWLLDDGSDDDTACVAQTFAERDARFHYISLPHRGIPATLNAGLRLCHTPLIGRMDGDDVCAPTRLEAQLRLLDEQPDVGVAACQIRSFRSDGSPPGSGMQRYVRWVNRVLTPDEHFRERYVESAVAHSSILAPRDVLLSAYDGYREPDWCEDYDLWLALLQRGVRFAKVPEVLLSVRDDAGRISRNDDHYSQDALRRCKLDHLLERNGPLAGRSRILFWGAGRVGKRWLRELPAFGVDVDAAVDLDPRKLGKRIHHAPVIAPEELRGRWGKLTDPFLLVGVGARGARAEIRGFLDAHGFTELDDYLVVA